MLAPEDRLSLRIGLAEALVDDGRFAEAEEHTRAAERLAPESFDVHMHLAAIHEVQGEMPEAEASFRAALNVRQNAAPALRGSPPTSEASSRTRILPSLSVS